MEASNQKQTDGGVSRSQGKDGLPTRAVSYQTERMKQMATPTNHALHTMISVAEAVACRGDTSVANAW